MDKLKNPKVIGLIVATLLGLFLSLSPFASDLTATICANLPVPTSTTAQ